MGRVAKVLSFLRVTSNGAKVSDVKIDSGGGANITAEHFAPVGDDSFPLTTDYALSVSTRRSGGEAVVGYVDPINTPKAEEGDKRIYARDPSDGSVVVEVWLKNDGTATTDNANGSMTLSPNGSIKGSNSLGSFELQAGGNFVVNGVTIDPLGNITSPTSVSALSIKAAGLELAGHVHLAGTPPGNTGVNL